MLECVCVCVCVCGQTAIFFVLLLITAHHYAVTSYTHTHTHTQKRTSPRFEADRVNENVNWCIDLNFVPRAVVCVCLCMRVGKCVHMCHIIPQNQYECKNDVNIFILSSLASLCTVTCAYVCVCVCVSALRLLDTKITHKNSEYTKILLTLHEIWGFPKKRENSEKEELTCVSWTHAPVWQFLCKCVCVCCRWYSVKAFHINP